MAPPKISRPPFPHPDIPGACLVPLTRGYFAIIDAADAETVSAWCWYTLLPSKNRKSPYAKTSIPNEGHNRSIFLHRFLWDRWGLPDTPQIDHENRNGLDCRRENLRAATETQNARNRGLRIDSGSGYRGVSWLKKQQRWRACIHTGEKRLSLGCYATALEAAKAYDLAAVWFFDDFLYLNKPANDPAIAVLSDEEYRELLKMSEAPRIGAQGIYTGRSARRPSKTVAEP